MLAFAWGFQIDIVEREIGQEEPTYTTIFETLGKRVPTEVEALEAALEQITARLASVRQHEADRKDRPMEMAADSVRWPLGVGEITSNNITKGQQ